MEKLHEVGALILAIGMAGTPGLNVPTSGDPSTDGAHVQAVTLAIGQMFVVLSLIGVTVYLLAVGREVDGQLWTLDVSLVSFYIGQRINLVSPR